MSFTLGERVWARAVENADGCWEWQGARTDQGYGHLRVDGDRLDYTHRVSYEAMVAEIPDGLVLDHLCRNRACCNPWHLEPVTRAVNNWRRPNLHENGHHAKTHCPYGHPYAGDNLWTDSRGWRHCRTCSQARQKASYEAAREAAGRPKQRRWSEATKVLATTRVAQGEAQAAVAKSLGIPPPTLNRWIKERHDRLVEMVEFEREFTR